MATICNGIKRLNEVISDGFKVKNITDVTGLTAALGTKAEKIIPSANGNFAGLDSAGNLTDSGKKASDFADADKIYKSDSLYIKVEESQSTHDHDKVKLQASAVGGDAVTEDISTIADSSNPFSATRRKIVASGAIKDALDSKLDLSIIQITNTSQNTSFDLKDTVFGKRYLLHGGPSSFTWVNTIFTDSTHTGSTFNVSYHGGSTPVPIKRAYVTVYGTETNGVRTYDITLDAVFTA